MIGKKKRKKGFAANAQTLKMLRASGWTAEVVEKRLPKCFITKDLFGFIDIVAMRPDGHGVLGVQATTASNRAARRDKILASAEAKMFCQASNKIWLVTWGLQGPRGQAKRWVGTVEAIDADSFLEANQ